MLARNSLNGKLVIEDFAWSFIPSTNAVTSRRDGWNDRRRGSTSARHLDGENE
jgi:hypothetical protein